MNRFNLLFLLSPVFFFSCQSESPPPKAETEKKVQTELTFMSLKNSEASANMGTWVGKAFLETPISGTKISTQEGKGVLVLDSSDGTEQLFASPWKHGDLELDLEFMVSKGAEASILFQSAYSLIIADSWGEKQANRHTVGSIDEKGPALNAALAPGLWQHLRVLFHAPNLKNRTGPIFSKVLLNGMLIYEDLDLNAVGTIAPEESLVLLAKKGSVAFRNIGYKLYTKDLPTLDSLSFSYYPLSSVTTAPDSIPDFGTMEATASGQTDTLSVHVTEERKDFGLVFEGKFLAPAAGDYLFESRVQGGAILLIDGKEVVNHDGESNYEERSAFGKVNLNAGPHNFKLLYRKEHMQWRYGLALFVEGPGIEKMPLHTQASGHIERKPKPFELKAEEGVSLHRSYLMHHGKKLTHAISIGNANGVQYSYDLDNASLLQMWGGKFMDVRQMWVGRGAEQLAVPMGATIVLSGKPNIAFLSNQHTPWPASLEESDKIIYKGYDIASDGNPTFRYAVGEGMMTDQIETRANPRSLNRTISLDASSPSMGYVLLARGKEIHEGPEGYYGADAFNFYLKVDKSDEEAIIRKTDTGQELLLPISSNSSITYTLTW